MGVIVHTLHEHVRPSVPYLCLAVFMGSVQEVRFIWGSWQRPQGRMARNPPGRISGTGEQSRNVVPTGEFALDPSNHGPGLLQCV